MDKLQKVQNQSVSTPLVGKELDIVIPLVKINILSPFRIQDEILEMWSMEINRMLPQLEVNELEELMDAFMIGELEYDHKLGVQNVFRGLVEKFPSKYYTPKMVY